MAHYERNFRTNAEDPLSLDEFLTLLGDGANADARTREDAIACVLSAGEGWQDAVKQLGGAFAEQAARLRERKAD